MELSENLKMRSDMVAGDPRLEQPEVAGGEENGVIDDTESQMRKALGLLGDASRKQEADRMDMPTRGGGERFNGGLHRRRFVQDGDVPVTVLRREASAEPVAHRGTAQPAAQPSSSRLQRTEAALAAETAAREKADRSLLEAQALIRDLQTKIGHAELAKKEAIETLQQEREQTATFRAEAESWEERLQEAEERAVEAEHVAQEWQGLLHEERNARKAAEKALRQLEGGRVTSSRMTRPAPKEERAPRRARAVEAEPAAVAATPAPVAPAPVAAAPTRRSKAVEQAAPAAPAAEQGPVKWWLAGASGAKKR
jgi:hypothetical protein